MKFLCYLLSLCLLCFSALPCAEAASSTVEKNTEEQLRDCAEENSCEDEGTDDCSASCNCHCCHVHSTLITAESIPVFAPQLKTENIPLTHLLFSKKLFSIWHPPKV